MGPLGPDALQPLSWFGLPATIEPPGEVIQKQRRQRLALALHCRCKSAFLTSVSEGDSGGDLGTVHNSFETKIVFLEVTAESPVTDLSKDGTS